MRLRIITPNLIIAGLMSLSTSGYAQQPDSAKMAEMQAKFMAAMKPGEAHKVLEKLAGTWNLAGNIWYAPGAKAVASEGTATNELVMDGRFLLERSSNQLAGENSLAMNIIGYDGRYDRYTDVRYDNMGTYYVTGSGRYDMETASLIFEGEEFDPLMGFTLKYKYVYRFVDANSYEFTFFYTDETMTKNTGEFKAMEIMYTRLQ